MRQPVEELIPFAQLDADPWPAYALDHEGRMVYINPSWDSMARAWGGPSARGVLGTLWLDHIAGDEPKEWHRQLLTRLLRAPSYRRRGSVLSCDCNTPARWRVFATRYTPLSPSPDAAVIGVLVMTRLLEDQAIGDRFQAAPFDERRFVHPGGLLKQCSGCRRLQVAGSDPSEWEMVPTILCPTELRSKISHGICPGCRQVYYVNLI